MPAENRKTEEPAIKSLMIVKGVLDAALKHGVFPNMETVVNVIENYNVVSEFVENSIKIRDMIPALKSDNEYLSQQLEESKANGTLKSV